VKTAARDFRQVLDTLQSLGLLLLTDARLPSAAAILAGETISGSWWSHPRAREIFIGLNKLEAHPDVLITKLVSGKVTFLHRELWSDLLSIAAARERWQMRGLSAAAKYLLRLVDKEGLVQSDEIVWPRRFQSEKIGGTVRELELRLLIHTRQVHTESGAHARMLETWRHWRARIEFPIEPRSPAESRHLFESLITNLNEQYGARARLGWQAGSSR